MEPSQIESMAAQFMERYHQLQKMMSDPDLPRSAEFTAVAREYHDLSKKADKFREWRELCQELAHLEEMANSDDPVFSKMARSELDVVRQKCGAAENGLLSLLRPPDPDDAKNIVLEIRAGTGGEEAALFASDLARMYMRFADRNSLKWETVDASLTDRGGFKEGIFLVERKPGGDASPGPFSIFKYERGVHRVQRIPVTEASGRIHTSTVTVAVLPEVEDVEVQVRAEDLRVDTYRASGHGGQHLQKTDSAVRITHLPTGVVVQCQDERSQQKNREKAMKILRARLYETARINQNSKIASERKKQVGRGERSEKIRTYNFPQDRITDHRIGFSMRNMQEVLDGGMDAIVRALKDADEKGAPNSAVENEDN